MTEKLTSIIITVISQWIGGITLCYIGHSKYYFVIYKHISNISLTNIYYNYCYFPMNRCVLLFALSVIQNTISVIYKHIRNISLTNISKYHFYTVQIADVKPFQ